MHGLAAVAMALGIGLTLLGHVLVAASLPDGPDMWAQVPVDGHPHRVDVPGDWDAAIWAPETSWTSCEIADSSGSEVTSRSASGFETDVDDVAHRAVSRFITGTGNLVVTCTSSAHESRSVRVGELQNHPSNLLKLVGVLPGFSVLICGIAVCCAVSTTWLVGWIAGRRRQ